MENHRGDDFASDEFVARIAISGLRSEQLSAMKHLERAERHFFAKQNAARMWIVLAAYVERRFVIAQRQRAAEKRLRWISGVARPVAELRREATYSAKTTLQYVRDARARSADLRRRREEQRNAYTKSVGAVASNHRAHVKDLRNEAETIRYDLDVVLHTKVSDRPYSGKRPGTVNRATAAGFEFSTLSRSAPLMTVDTELEGQKKTHGRGDQRRGSGAELRSQRDGSIVSLKSRRSSNMSAATTTRKSVVIPGITMPLSAGCTMAGLGGTLAPKEGFLVSFEPDEYGEIRLPRRNLGDGHLASLLLLDSIPADECWLDESASSYGTVTGRASVVGDRTPSGCNELSTKAVLHHTEGSRSTPAQSGVLVATANPLSTSTATCLPRSPKQCLTQLAILVGLHLNNNMIGDAGAEIVACLLRRAPPALTTVDLSRNVVTDVGARSLYFSVPYAPQLTEFSLEKNSGVTPSVQSMIRELIEDPLKARALRLSRYTNNA